MTTGDFIEYIISKVTILLINLLGKSSYARYDMFNI
jgi:hypothetical protein